MGYGAPDELESVAVNSFFGGSRSKSILESRLYLSAFRGVKGSVHSSFDLFVGFLDNMVRCGNQVVGVLAIILISVGLF